MRRRLIAVQPMEICIYLFDYAALFAITFFFCAASAPAMHRLPKTKSQAQKIARNGARPQADHPTPNPMWLNVVFPARLFQKVKQIQDKSRKNS